MHIRLQFSAQIFPWVREKLEFAQYTEFTAMICYNVVRMVQILNNDD